MEYTISKFFQKYFEKYCEQVVQIDPKIVTQKAQVIYNDLMHNSMDMGGKDNMMASNIDMTAAFLAYYEASDHKIGGEAIEVLLDWLSHDYQWVGFFTDMNKRKYVRPLYYKIYSKHAKEVEAHKAKGEWMDTWSFDINPDNREEGIYYHMKNCPLKKFVHMTGYDDLMPYICKFDFIFEKFLHARLIRTQTEATGGDCCDYWFVPDQSETAKKFKDFESI